MQKLEQNVDSFANAILNACSCSKLSTIGQLPVDSLHQIFVFLLIPKCTNSQLLLLLLFVWLSEVEVRWCDCWLNFQGWLDLPDSKVFSWVLFSPRIETCIGALVFGGIFCVLCFSLCNRGPKFAKLHCSMVKWQFCDILAEDRCIVSCWRSVCNDSLCLWWRRLRNYATFLDAVINNYSRSPLKGIGYFHLFRSFCLWAQQTLKQEGERV